MDHGTKGYDSRLRRRILLGTFGIVTVITMAATVILTDKALTSHADTADRLAAAGDVLVGATLLLAAVAALVALLAYAVSTGLPNLQIRFAAGNSGPNNPQVEAGNKNNSLAARTSTENIITTRLRNNSGYSAKNPAVIIRLHGILLSPDHLDDAWVPIDFGPAGTIQGIQWDGGPTYSIHGHSTRRLPDLSLNDLLLTTPATGLEIELLADGGYRKLYKYWVNVTEDGRLYFGGPNPFILDWT